MKKILALFLALLMALSTCAVLASCDDTAETGETTSSESTEATESTDTEETSAETNETGSDTDTDTEETDAPIDPSTIYGNGADIEDAGIDWEPGFFANVKHTIDEEKAQDISADALLAKMENRSGDDALKEGEVWHVSGELVLQESTKYYGNGATIIVDGGVFIKNAIDVVLKNIRVKGNITIKNSAEVVFYKVDVQSDATAVTIDANSSDMTFNTCRLYGDEYSVKSSANNVTIYSCYARARNGLELNGDNVTVQNCKVYAILNAVFVAGDSAIVRENTIRAVSSGAGVTVGSGSVNSLVALNDIDGIQKSITVEDSFNTAVVLNSAVTIHGSDNTNLYVVDNQLGGYINLQNNNYLVCDGNAYPFDGLVHTLVDSNNTNVNGDSITDVDARVEVGANEELLPHTNKDLFVGMERKTSVTDASFTSTKGLNAYIKECAMNNSVVIVPPGAYAVPTSVTIDGNHSDTTVYAYGVYEECSETDQSKYTMNLLRISGASNVNIYGLTVGRVLPSSGQIRVVEKYIEAGGKKYGVNDEIPSDAGKRTYKLTVISDAGFFDGLTKTDPTLFHTWWPETFLVDENGEYKMYNEENPQSCHEIVKNYDEDGNYDGTMTVTLESWSNGVGGDYSQQKSDRAVWERITEGTIMTCRFATGTATIWIGSSSNILLRDCVLYGYAGGLANVATTSSNVHYYRFHNTTHSENLIDKETYDKYVAIEEKWGVDMEVREEVLEDGTVRYRGPASRSGSIDAFHITHNITGVDVTSSLLEGMVDDGSNQHAASSRLDSIVDNGDGTTTIFYKGTMTGQKWGSMFREGVTEEQRLNYFGFSTCTNFQEGNIVFIFAPSGKILCETPALTEAVYVRDYLTTIGKYSKKCAVYSVTVATKDVDFSALIDPVTKQPYDLADNDNVDKGWYDASQRIAVDNLSYNCCNYTMDNVMVHNGHSRGFLIKSTDVVIKHCTFRNVSYSGLLIQPEISWAESTISRRIHIQQVLFDHTGYIYNNVFSKDQACIRIESTSTFVSEDTLPIDDITITGCKFTNNEQRYAIYINSAKNITITNNTFDENTKNILPKVTGCAIALDTCMNIEISDNTYNYEHYEGNITNVIRGSNYKNITGTDVTKDGKSLLPDNLD